LSIHEKSSFNAVSESTAMISTEVTLKMGVWTTPKPHDRSIARISTQRTENSIPKEKALGLSQERIFT
jgi:hypothetical protein